MNREKIFEKIKKCLALSKSANEHEAASAMRQAQRLMEIHNLNCSDIGILEIEEMSVHTKQKRHPAWLDGLATTVAVAFECSVVAHRGQYTFVGEGGAPEVASYSFEVLYRQLMAAKKSYLDNPHRKAYWSAATSRKMGRAFCEGWIHGVYKLVNEFAKPLTSEDKARHMDYVETKRGRRPERGAEKKSAIDDHTHFAASSGFSAGQKVKLNHGVAAGERPAMIGIL